VREEHQFQARQPAAGPLGCQVVFLKHGRACFGRLGAPVGSQHRQTAGARGQRTRPRSV